MKKVIHIVLLLLFIFTSITLISYSASNVTWKDITKSTKDLGYGVTLDVEEGISTSTYVESNRERAQRIFTLNVPKTSKPQIVQWARHSGVENSWGSFTLESIAKDYEDKHPGKKVIAGTNNWLDITNTSNVGELQDGPQIIGGLNYRLRNGHGNTGDEKYSFLGFDKTGKQAIYYGGGIWGENMYTIDFGLYSYLDNLLTPLNFQISKVNEEPLDGEISIILPSYKGDTTFTNSLIYRMKGQMLKYDESSPSSEGVKRDVFCQGKYLGKSESIDFDYKNVGMYIYYFVSKNAEFNKLNWINSKDSSIVCQHDLKSEYSNIYSGTHCFTEIVKDGVDNSNVNYVSGQHPRTVFVIKKDGSFALSVVDGRQETKGACGFSYEEIAYYYMNKYDANEVFNYDGGGSSCMIVANKEGGFDIVNSPSDGHERLVANANLVVVDEPLVEGIQSNIEEGCVQVKLSKIASSVGLIYATMGDKKVEVKDRIATFYGLKSNSNYEVKLSYFLITGEPEIMGPTIQAKTCKKYAIPNSFSPGDITQNSVTLFIEIKDTEDSFYQGIIKIGDKEEYFDGLVSQTKITGLIPNTNYDVSVTIYSKTGTATPHSATFLYQVKTTEAIYPENLSISLNTTSFHIGDKEKLKVEFNPLGTTTKLFFSSSNEQVATVSAVGRIEAVGVGKSIIRVQTQEGKTAEISIEVLNDVIEPDPTDTKSGCSCKKNLNLLIYEFGVGLITLYIFRRKN